MSDLTGKFGSFEDQIAAQHTEIMEALNGIAFAMGAPPTTPTTTLEDLYTQMQALIDGVALIYSANATFHTALLTAHTNLLTSVDQISVNTDTMISNNSLNAQRMLTALYATFCECETDTPLLPQPIDVTPTELVDEDKCRRIQFYLDLFGQWLNAIANYGNAGAAITGATLGALLSSIVASVGLVATGAEVGAVAGPPGIVIGAALALITVAIYTFGGSVLVDYATQFSAPTLRDNMVQAMYLATNADEGYSAFKTTLLAGMDTIPAEIIYTLWWSAWSNDVYSGSPVVDDSAFDGEACTTPPEETWPLTIGCMSFTSVLTHASNGSTIQAIAWPDGTTVSPASASGAGSDLTADQPIFGQSSIAGMWASSVPTCHVYWEATGVPNFDVGATPVQLPLTGGNYYSFLTDASAVFEITICVEEPA